MGRKKKFVLLTIGIVGIVFFATFLTIFFQNYYDPGNSEAPVFSLPIKSTNYDNVTGVQRFHPPDHNGLDFKLLNTTEIIAPIGGKITSIEHHMMTNNLWIVDVFLRINPAWGMFIAFEPWTYNEADVIAQKTNISAYISIGKVVAENQTLGWLLPVAGSEFPHIHWSVFKVSAAGLLGNSGSENVNPYSYLTPWAKTICDGYCAAFWDYNPCG